MHSAALPALPQDGDAPDGGRAPVLLSRAPDQVAAIVRDWILDGRLRPGARLRVGEIAAQLGVSPMPVREALRRLEASGLVVTRSHHGTWVARLDAEEIEQLYDVRIILEPEAGRRATARLDAKREEALQQRLHDLREAAASGDPVHILDADEALLATLLECCGNRELMRTILGLWQRVRPHKLRHVAFVVHAAPPQAADELTLCRWASDLVHACLGRDGELVAERIRRPLEAAKADLVAFIRAHDPAGTPAVFPRPS